MTPNRFVGRRLRLLHPPHHPSPASRSCLGGFKYLAHLVTPCLFVNYNLEALKVGKCSSLRGGCALLRPRRRIPSGNNVGLVHVFLHGTSAGIAREVWNAERREGEVSVRECLTWDTSGGAVNDCLGKWVRKRSVWCDLCTLTLLWSIISDMTAMLSACGGAQLVDSSQFAIAGNKAHWSSPRPTSMKRVKFNSSYEEYQISSF